ncbi:hypothetical protein [Streptomyces coffeae]|uniref:Uncharacterized protein n=1 Tax=Streptomyces coffeae TaxID=621382 RepID=A0ABS1N9G1_9ACTN|nr:hypothetical protein [Streptomyces coffeae]MBL1096710.1 hypothetical protein [Streptomyces coffeae]
MSDDLTYEDEARLTSRTVSMLLADPFSSFGDIKAATVTMQRALDDLVMVAESRQRQLDRLTDGPAQHPE